ncbi:Vacuolar protein sorting-associated protein 35, partial [Rhizoclosmatium hyalinum]
MLTVGAVFMRVAKEIRAAPPQTASAKGKEPVRADDPAIPPSRPKPANPIHDVPPVKELLKDMLDMALGVQHPVRGLFLRYYLTSMTRDFMPDADQDNFYGCRMDSIQFLLQNFVEMNKLWVRLQYMGHSREREQREMERRELKLLVGSNLLRLSQLEGLGSDVFANLILPSIMSEVVNCRDVMAQEYLMEVVIQVFPDDFHLHTLDMFLAATSQLSRDVNVKQTIMSLVNRFTSFARRAREEHAAKVKEATAKGESLLPATISGIPEGVMLFEIFWEQVTEHIAVRPEFQLHDVISLLSSLVELSTGCYPTRYNYVDQVLGYAKKRVLSVVLNKEPAMTAPETAASLLQLLLTTLSAYRSNPLAFLSFPSSVRNGGGVTVSSVSNAFEGLVMGGGSNQASSNANQTQGAAIPDQPSTSLCGNFTDLLRLQPFLSRKKVAQLFIDLAVNASNPLAKNAVKFRLDSVDAVDAAFGEICEVLVKDNVDGGLTGSKIVRSDGATEEVSGWWIGTVSNGEEETLAPAAVDVESLVREISGVGKLVNLVGSRRGHPDDDVEILGAIRNHVSSGGDMRLKFTIPPLIYRSVAVARNYLGITDLSHLTVIQRLNTLFQFANESIHTLRESDTSQTIQTTSAIRAAASREAEIRT